MNENVKLNFTIPKSWYIKFKVKLAYDQSNISQFLRKAVKNYIDKKEEENLFE